jgi:hypothetical protein
MPLILPYSGLLKAKVVASGVTATNTEDPTDGNNDDGSNVSSYSFSIDAGGGGLIAVGFVSTEGNATNDLNVTSVTIDGQTATVVEATGLPVSGGDTTCIAYAAGVSSGTVTVVVTFDDVASNIQWTAWRISGHASSTPHDTLSVYEAGGTDSDVSGTINIPDGGCCIALANAEYQLAGDHGTWTGLTEDGSRAFSGAQFSAASASNMSTETGRTITCTFDDDDAGASSTGARKMLVAISWG